MNITEILKPIELKAGTHADTAQTGSGCFMNVVAYLNGEPQITDRSPCVHPVLREFLICINDNFVPRGLGPDLIPFIHRAMGTQGMDGQKLAFQFANAAVRRFAPIALRARGFKESAQTLEMLPVIACRQTATYAATVVRTAESAADAAARTYACASEAAGSNAAATAARTAAARTADNSVAASISAAIIQTLDEILPPATEQELAVLERAKNLAMIAA